MLYIALVLLVSINSVFAVGLLISFQYLKTRYGIEGMTERVNRLAGTRTIFAVQIYAYISMLAWVALALPWLDLLTVQKLAHFKSCGMESYLGAMTSHQASIYFIAMFFNIVGAKGALIVAELATLLRRGRVRMKRFGMLFAWSPEQIY